MSLIAPTSIRWMFLDLNSYFASVEQQLHPELRGKPVAVVPLETEATCAIAASYEAKAYGIRTGTRIYEAKRLCPELICVPANHEHYVTFHHHILESIDRHIPVADVASIDEVACELDVSERRVSEAVALAKRIKQGIYRDVGSQIRCSIGIAPNRFLAKVATELQKPDGLVVIRPDDIPGKLLSLSFNDIPGLGRGMQHRLYKAGISTMEQLYAVPPKHMRALWHSVAGERMWYKLRGVELESEPSQRRTVGHSHVHAPENRPEPMARLVSQRLLLKAVSRMRRLGYHTTLLTVSLRTESGQRFALDRQFTPLHDHIHLQQHWELLWERLVRMTGQVQPRIKKTSITLHGLVADAQVQPDLFDAPEVVREAEAHDRLSGVMDTLNQRYGRGTVTMASTLGKATQATGTKIAFSRIPDREEFQE